jgi:DNA-directed RNA polymerases I, II, and III subunit RPABC4
VLSQLNFSFHHLSTPSQPHTTTYKYIPHPSKHQQPENPTINTSPPSTSITMAQREAYQLPEHRNTFSQSQSQSQGQTSGGAYNYAAGATRVPAEIDQTVVSVTYKCGECGAQVALFKGDVVRCDKCGHRVLYKERTKRMVQFEAR